MINPIDDNILLCIRASKQLAIYNAPSLTLLVKRPFQGRQIESLLSD